MRSPRSGDLRLSFRISLQKAKPEPHVICSQCRTRSCCHSLPCSEMALLLKALQAAAAAERSR